MKFSRKADGFTLIELLIVVIILSVLAVKIVPRFFDSNGFSEFAYRADIIAKLQLIRNTALQQTSTIAGQCHRVFIDTINNKVGAPSGDCDANPTFSDPAALAGQDLLNYQRRVVEIDPEDNVNVTSNVGGDTFTFDNFGRPVGCGPCTITITSDLTTLTVTVEREGYIHD